MAVKPVGEDVGITEFVTLFFNPCAEFSPAQGYQQQQKNKKDMVSEHPQLPALGRYSKKQVAEILGISSSTVTRIVSSGKLKIGGYRNKGGERPLRYYLGKDINTFWATK